MRLLDVNVLLYSLRDVAPDHERYRAWLLRAIEGPEPVGVADLVLSGFIRVATHPRVFDPPASTDDAFAFAFAIRDAPSAVQVVPGSRHWELFRRMCRDGGARGNLVADAYLAALAVESGSELITTDRDFARFPGLRWRHPLS